MNRLIFVSRITNFKATNIFQPTPKLRFFASTSIRKHTKSEGYLSILPKYKGIITESISTEGDLQAAYDEYVKYIKTEEQKHKLKCIKCGISPLQSENPQDVNYYKIPKMSLKLPSKNKYMIPEQFQQEVFESLNLSDDNEVLVSEFDVMFEQKVKKLAEICTEKMVCNRCREMNEHSVYELSDTAVKEVMKNTPTNGTVVNVLSILDFPLSCDKEILQGRNPKDIYYVITKADLFYRKSVQINRSGLSYVQDVLQKYMGADPNKVFFVSSTKSWNVKEFSNALPSGKIYFVGRANAGKSNLIRSLVAVSRGIDVNDKVVKNIEKKNMDYLQKVGLDAPGVFHIPGYTRGFQEYKFERYTIFDSPGFFPSDFGLYKYMTDEVVTKKNKYATFMAEDHQRCAPLDVKGPKVFNGDALYSYGGLFYLQPPKGAIFKRCIAFNKRNKEYEVRYGSMMRAREINEKRPESVVSRYAVKKEAFENLERFVIPPFYGIIDIVIQDLGFMTIAPTSSPSDVTGLFQIWVPRGARVIVRESIFNYLYKTHSNKDETGNRLRKENVSRRGTTTLKTIFDEKKLHLTELMPVDTRLSNEEAFAKVCPLEDMVIPENKLKGMTQSKFKNQYWRSIIL